MDGTVLEALGYEWYGIGGPRVWMVRYWRP